MLKRSFFLFFISFLFIAFLTTCKKKDDKREFNIFSIEDDKKFGKQMDDYIRSDTSGYVVLDPLKYPESYAYLESVKNYILNSGKITYKTEFEWKAAILKDDSILNAFATPGGYFYIYTGLIKYLEKGDHFAGVTGHEMAHADRRHSTAQMTKQYGIQLLFDIVLGKNPGAVAQVAAGLATLSFSREHESEADEYSVRYLCQSPAQYEADGAAGFFEKLIAEGQAGNTPEFLSTHPSPSNRVPAIKDKAVELGCDTLAKDPFAFHKMKMELGFE